MKITPPDRRRTVRILKSIAPPKHRDFRTAFKNGKPRNLVASYLRKTRTVTIYCDYFDNSMDLVAAGLHEIAHHINWNGNGGPILNGRLNLHGKEFRRILSWLVRKFNARYRGVTGGVIVYNPRKPTRSPRFVKL